MIMLLLNVKRRWECERLLSGTKRYDSVLDDDEDDEDE